MTPRLLPTIVSLCVIFVLATSQIAAFPVASKQETTSPAAKSSPKKPAKKRKKRKSSVTTLWLPLASIPQSSVPQLNRVFSTTRVAPAKRESVTTAARPSAPVLPTSAAAPTPTTFTNSGTITIDTVIPDQDPVPTTPYPSDIDVTGLTGVITDLSVTIHSLSHTRPDDLEM